MQAYKHIKRIQVPALCLLAGIVIGQVWEKRTTNSEWRRWLSLSERVDSMSGSWEHDMYVLEDRFGRIEDQIALSKQLCLSN